jgi:hypothetical protein
MSGERQDTRPDQQADAHHPGRRGDLRPEIMLERQREGIAKANAAGKTVSRIIGVAFNQMPVANAMGLEGCAFDPL